jgi:hypothetical protein
MLKYSLKRICKLVGLARLNLQNNQWGRMFNNSWKRISRLVGLAGLKLQINTKGWRMQKTA